MTEALSRHYNWRDRPLVAPTSPLAQSGMFWQVLGATETLSRHYNWRDMPSAIKLHCYVLLLSLYGSLLFPAVFLALHCWSLVRFPVSDHIKLFRFALLMVSALFSV